MMKDIKYYIDEVYKQMPKYINDEIVKLCVDIKTFKKMEAVSHERLTQYRDDTPNEKFLGMEIEVLYTDKYTFEVKEEA